MALMPSGWRNALRAFEVIAQRPEKLAVDSTARTVVTDCAI